VHIDLTSLLQDTISQLKAYESTETVSTILEDKTLYGYLSLGKELLSIYI